MRVAVTIVAFRNHDDIARCLQALSISTHANFEVVIVENGGSAAFAALQARTLPALPGGQPVRLVEAPGNVGFAAGQNLAMDHSADADAWWILNPDTKPSPGALAALVARLVRGDCDAVGGVLHFENRKIQGLGGAWQPWLARAVSIGNGTSLDEPIDGAAVEARMNYILGASALVGRPFIAKAGRMRDDYFLYAEEVEWFLRGVQNGARLGFAPNALVMHDVGTSTGMGHRERDRPKMPIYLDTRNRVLATRDRYPGRLPVVAAATLLFTLYRFARKGAWRQMGYAADGWVAGIRNQRGLPPWMRG
ncbi:MAG: glycosyltransferase family 2 protein [Sphingobium sp.]|nr:glycosyltransferase family 2 protein [Sphingobium sp.]